MHRLNITIWLMIIASGVKIADEPFTVHFNHDDEQHQNHTPVHFQLMASVSGVQNLPEMAEIDYGR
jgi:hypothetical protein